MLFRSGQGGDLEAAKHAWLNAPAWQALRRYVEDSFVLKDWFELYVAQNVALDGLLFPLAYREVDRALAAKAGPTVSMLTRFQSEWFDDACKWTDAVMKTAAAESAANRDQLQAWLSHWRGRALQALEPIARLALGEAAGAALDHVAGDLDARMAKAGVTGR